MVAFSVSQFLRMLYTQVSGGFRSLCREDMGIEEWKLRVGLQKYSVATVGAADSFPW